MYCVVKGRKHFTLLPPSDVAFLYEGEYQSARYVHGSTAMSPSSTGKLLQYKRHPSWLIEMEPETSTTPWIPVEPLEPDYEKYPLSSHLAPIECVIEPGEMLYLPALWYHRATQLCETVSVNYWYTILFKIYTLICSLSM